MVNVDQTHISSIRKSVSMEEWMNEVMERSSLISDLYCWAHSLKNWTGPAIEPEKTETDDLNGF